MRYDINMDSVYNNLFSNLPASAQGEVDGEDIFISQLQVDSQLLADNGHIYLGADKRLYFNSTAHELYESSGDLIIKNNGTSNAFYINLEAMTNSMILRSVSDTEVFRFHSTGACEFAANQPFKIGYTEQIKIQAGTDQQIEATSGNLILKPGSSDDERVIVKFNTIDTQDFDVRNSNDDVALRVTGAGSLTLQDTVSSVVQLVVDSDITLRSTSGDQIQMYENATKFFDGDADTTEISSQNTVIKLGTTTSSTTFKITDSAGTTLWSIDGGGSITTSSPSGSTKVGFKGGVFGSYTLASATSTYGSAGTWTTDFNYEDATDNSGLTSGNGSLHNGVFTCDVAGYYEVYAICRADNGGSEDHFEIQGFKNGSALDSPVEVWGTAENNRRVVQITVFVNLAQGDTILFRSDYVSNDRTHNYFMMHGRLYST